ncbi:hypothetical protein LTR66_016075, partial [Elasticomyces elasticus]
MFSGIVSDMKDTVASIKSSHSSEGRNSSDSDSTRQSGSTAHEISTEGQVSSEVSSATDENTQALDVVPPQVQDCTAAEDKDAVMVDEPASPGTSNTFLEHFRTHGKKRVSFSENDEVKQITPRNSLRVE